MEKISGIIPANNRTKAVDVSNSQPVRPGAPTWGRPNGKVTRNTMPDPLEKVSFSRMDSPSKSEFENPIQQTTYNSRGQVAKAQVVEELSKKFFAPNAKNLARDSDETLSEQAQNRVLENEFALNPKIEPEDSVKS
ncbi:MAG: hypothetical protein AABY64_10460 [Bdellovibrionota bacterium]